MKRFYYARLVDGQGVRLETMQADKYDDAIKELGENGVVPLFLSAYTTPLSRFIYKYLRTLSDLGGDQFTSEVESDNGWKVTRPYLYYNTKKYEFVASETLLFGDYALQLIGYVPSKAFQDLLIRKDF